jgi:hypothetical protein
MHVGVVSPKSRGRWGSYIGLPKALQAATGKRFIAMVFRQWMRLVQPMTLLTIDYTISCYDAHELGELYGNDIRCALCSRNG